MGMLLGTYLPRPVTTKHSHDDENDKIVFGVSSMQGWRETQEDAHNCILELDPGISVFAVYDGHGGCEVSEYAAQTYPKFLKENPYFLQGDYENGLKDSFVKFDCSLTQKKIIKLLYNLSKTRRRFTNDEAVAEAENLKSLKAEALMPLEEVLAKYALSRKKSKRSKGSKGSKGKKTNESASTSSSGETVRANEVNSVDSECSSSKSNTVSLSESDSEVTSSSSLGAVEKKSLSEKCNNNDDVTKTLLDSTSNGTEASDSSGSSQNVIGGVSSESNVSERDAQPGSSKGCTSEKSENSATCSKSVESKNRNVRCNGQSVDIESDEVISSSVENGEVEVSKSSGKGKSLVKHQPKKAEEEKKSESSESLFRKFILSEMKDESSESDSDDATFTDPDSKSDDDNDDEDEEDVEEEEEEGEEEEDEDDDEDEEEEEEDEEEEEEEEEKVEVEDKPKIEEDVKDDDEEKLNLANEKAEKSEDTNVKEEEEDSDEEDDERNLLEPGADSGCTALVAVIIDNKLYVANAGDCRCVVSKNGEAIEMSLDHKPENDIELRRIQRAGGRVHGGRVNDGLNLSRAFGDHVYKRTPNLPPEEQMISPLPDVQTLDLDPDVEFMVLACDGIWNSMSSKQVVDFVRARLQNRRGNLSIICEQLFDHCLAPDTLCDGTGCDNMTAIIILFKNSKFFSTKKRPVEENEAEEAPKKQKTADVTSTDSIDSSQPSDSGLEKPSNSPDTTQ